MSLDGAGGEHPGDEPAEPVVGVALVGEHQASVPATQRTVLDAEEVEDRQPDADHRGVVREALDLGVAEHDHGARVRVDRRR